MSVAWDVAARQTVIHPPDLVPTVTPQTAIQADLEHRLAEDHQDLEEVIRQEALPVDFPLAKVH